MIRTEEEIVEKPVGVTASSGDDLSPSIARSVGAVLAERRLSWREVLDDSALVTAALVGAAAALVAVRVLRRP